MRPMGNRKKGDIYITGGTENRDLHKAKYFDGKRFMVRKISLSKEEVNGAADAHRAQGHLAKGEVIVRKELFDQNGDFRKFNDLWEAFQYIDFQR